MNSESNVVDWDRTVQCPPVAATRSNAKSESPERTSFTGHLPAASRLSSTGISPPPAFRGAGNVSLLDDQDALEGPPEARHTLAPGQSCYKPFETFKSQYLNSDVPVPYPASATDSDTQQSLGASTTCKLQTERQNTGHSAHLSLSPSTSKSAMKRHQRSHPHPYLPPTIPSLAISPSSGPSIQSPHDSPQDQDPGSNSSDAGSKNVCDFPDCGLEFKTPWHLLSHRNCHTNVRQFLCTLCPLSFARKHDLTRHERSVHAVREGAPTFVCSLCGKGFGRVDSLKRHIKVCRR